MHVLTMFKIIQNPKSSKFTQTHPKSNFNQNPEPSKIQNSKSSKFIIQHHQQPMVSYRISPHDRRPRAEAGRQTQRELLQVIEDAGFVEGLAPWWNQDGRPYDGKGFFQLSGVSDG